MPTTIRFVISGLLLVTTILSILLWKRTDLAVDPTPGGSIKARVYDYTTASPYYSLSKPEHLMVLGNDENEEMEKLVEQFGREDLVTAIKMMPEHIQVQDKFLPYLLEEEVKQVKSSRKLHARLWNWLISRSDTSRERKNKLLHKAQEVRIHNLSENESNKAIGLTKTDNEDDVPSETPQKKKINPQYLVQKKMNTENRLERELEKEQSLINQLEAEIIDLEEEVGKEITAQGKLKQDRDNLRKYGRKTPY